jgi:membrane fusion protein (multidrug efflux system)
MNDNDRDGHASRHNGDGMSAKQSDERGDRRPDEKREGRGEERRRDKPKKFHLSRKTLITGGIVLGIILLGVFVYWLHARNFESTDDSYTTTHVHEISARVAGTVESVNVDDNEFVKGEQALVVLDQRDFKVTAQQARAQVFQRRATADQAQANQTHAQQDYDRFTKLGSEKVVSKQDVDNATAALKTANGALNAAKADLAAAEAALKNAELQLSYTTIVSPTDGLIGKKTVETGARVQPGQALMAVGSEDFCIAKILRYAASFD